MKLGASLVGAATAWTILFAGEADATSFIYSGATQFWTAQQAGTYAITAWGASGGVGGFIDCCNGYSVHSLAGRGIGIRDRVFLPKNLILAVAVGGAGEGDSASNAGGGGGGGSFVVIANGAPLVIAGGGGGGGWNDIDPASGGDAVFGVVNGGFGGPGGFQGGGGGGGFYSDGGQATIFDGDDFIPFGAEGGQGYPGLAGGRGDFAFGGNFGGPFNGGFGGGGGGGLCAGGGGGGFGGGAGADEGGCDGSGGAGGGSYASIGAKFLGYGARGDNGFVSITLVPEPAEWLLLTMGFGVLGGVLRKRRAGVDCVQRRGDPASDPLGGEVHLRAPGPFA